MVVALNLQQWHRVGGGASVLRPVVQAVSTTKRGSMLLRQKLVLSSLGDHGKEEENEADAYKKGTV